MSNFTRTTIFAAVLAGIAAPALAQAIPPGQSCGGLLCDMGVFGHKVPTGPDGTPPTQAQVAAVEAADPHRLPCNDFLCRAFGGKPATEAAAAPAAVPAPVAEPEPTQPAKKVRKKKRVAKAAEAPVQ